MKTNKPNAHAKPQKNERTYSMLAEADLLIIH